MEVAQREGERRCVIARLRLGNHANLGEESKELPPERDLHEQVELLLVRIGRHKLDDARMPRALERRSFGHHLVLLVILDDERLEDGLERVDLPVARRVKETRITSRLDIEVLDLARPHVATHENIGKRARAQELERLQVAKRWLGASGRATLVVVVLPFPPGWRLVLRLGLTLGLGLCICVAEPLRLGRRVALDLVELAQGGGEAGVEALRRGVGLRGKARR